jgi:hypothetical protein
MKAILARYIDVKCALAYGLVAGTRAVDGGT